MITKLANLWTPVVWLAAFAEADTRPLKLIRSLAVQRRADLDAVANGGGTKANVPFFKAIIEESIVQDEDVEVSLSNISTDNWVCAILNREFGLGATALSAAISASDPIGYIASQVSILRGKNMENSVYAALKGVFSGSEFNALKVDVSNESGTGTVFTPEVLIDATSKWDVLRNSYLNGQAVLVVHPDIEAALLKADLIDFQKDSAGALVMNTFMGLQLIAESSTAAGLKRAGTTAGSVYTSYVLAAGAIGYGEAAKQIGSVSVPVVGVSTFNLVNDVRKNQAGVIDRSRYIVHPVGASIKATATPAKVAGFSDAELAGNIWDKKLETTHIPFLAIRTNG